MARCSILLLALFVVVLATAPAIAAPGINSGARITLKEMLEKGLKARRPSEFAYIAMVAERVESGTLPRSLVESTFLWARKKRPHPFPYFQQGLALRAKKARIPL